MQIKLYYLRKTKKTAKKPQIITIINNIRAIYDDLTTKSAQILKSFAYNLELRLFPELSSGVCHHGQLGVCRIFCTFAQQFTDA